MAKADNERVIFAWQYGVQARKDGKDRAVPDFWHEFADAWLDGFDGRAPKQQAELFRKRRLTACSRVPMKQKGPVRHPARLGSTPPA